LKKLRKKDRTNEEKQFDAKIKTAMRKLGPNPQADATPIPFPYFLAWDRLGRKGQRVTIIRQSTQTAQVRFEDGFTTVINRQALRRI
jgi:hypothetical protein